MYSRVGKKAISHTNSAQNIIVSNADAHPLIVMCGIKFYAIIIEPFI